LNENISDFLQQMQETAEVLLGEKFDTSYNNIDCSATAIKRLKFGLETNLQTVKVNLIKRPNRQQSEMKLRNIFGVSAQSKVSNMPPKTSNTKGTTNHY
jgi:hypothetical protein